MKLILLISLIALWLLVIIAEVVGGNEPFPTADDESGPDAAGDDVAGGSSKTQ